MHYSGKRGKMKACKGCSGSKELNHKDCYFHNDGYCTFGEKQEGK